jgi:hypothetical protein
VAVTQDVDRNAGGEVQVALALLAIEIDAFASHRPNRRARINGHERRDGQGFYLPLCGDDVVVSRAIASASSNEKARRIAAARLRLAEAMF